MPVRIGQRLCLIVGQTDWEDLMRAFADGRGNSLFRITVVLLALTTMTDRQVVQRSLI